MRANVKKGVSLTETAIVLLVIGLVLAMMVAYFQSVTDTKRIIELKRDVETASQRIVDFATMNGRLPNADEYTALGGYKVNHKITYTFNIPISDKKYNRNDSICIVPNLTETYGYVLNGEDTGIKNVKIRAQRAVQKQVTLSELQERMACDRVKTKLMVTTRTLPLLRPPESLNAEILAKGGRPVPMGGTDYRQAYKWCATIDMDVNGIKAKNAALFKDRCFASATNTWVTLPFVQLRMDALSATIPAQTRTLTFFIADEQNTVVHRSITLRIDN